jgi:DNA-binding response OmpR family regulator
MNVLIVEDDLSIAGLLEQALESHGYRVIGIARNLEEAMALAEENDSDFAVVDIHLAGGGLGTEVADYLRSVSRVAILFSTGNDDQNLARFAGNAVMSKPYQMSDVACGLKIIAELAEFGRTERTYPRNFRVIESPL